MKWIFIASLFAAGCRPEPERFTVVPIALSPEMRTGPRAVIVDQRNAVAWILVDAGIGYYGFDRYKLRQESEDPKVTPSQSKIDFTPESTNAEQFLNSTNK